jgi:hypothetical protein
LMFRTKARRANDQGIKIGLGIEDVRTFRLAFNLHSYWDW